tara:strand:+ start:391 stop:1218 length:828 start_codon:yes stop_codon:yes gene_type:complete
MAEKGGRSWARLISIVAAGLLTISLISFATSMNTIEDILDPEKLNKGIVEKGDSFDLELQSGRTYTLLRIVNEVGDEAREDDVRIIDSDGNEMVIDAPTWMHPPRTGGGGAVIYDTIATYSTKNSGTFTFENLNATSKLYIVDDHEGDLAATREPTLLVASFGCCFGVLLLPIAGIVQLLTRKQRQEGLGNQVITMPTNTIPTTDELFLIREGEMKPEDVKGIRPVREVPPPFTSTQQTNTIRKEERTLREYSKRVEEEVVNDPEDDDWKAWDTG